MRYTTAMIGFGDLATLAQARLADAQALLAAQRFDGAVYLCGYSIELALKARICATLNWTGYPSTRAEFQQYQSFRTHDLDVLLHLSGQAATIRTHSLVDWSTVAQWDPEVRYRTAGTTTAAEASAMTTAATNLLEVL